MAKNNVKKENDKKKEELKNKITSTPVDTDKAVDVDYEAVDDILDDETEEDNEMHMIKLKKLAESVKGAKVYKGKDNESVLLKDKESKPEAKEEDKESKSDVKEGVKESKSDVKEEVKESKPEVKEEVKESKPEVKEEYNKIDSIKKSFSLNLNDLFEFKEFNKLKENGLENSLVILEYIINNINTSDEDIKNYLSNIYEFMLRYELDDSYKDKEVIDLLNVFANKNITPNFIECYDSLVSDYYKNKLSNINLNSDVLVEVAIMLIDYYFINIDKGESKLKFINAVNVIEKSDIEMFLIHLFENVA